MLSLGAIPLLAMAYGLVIAMLVWLVSTILPQSLPPEDYPHPRTVLAISFVLSIATVCWIREKLS